MISTQEPFPWSSTQNLRDDALLEPDRTALTLPLSWPLLRYVRFVFHLILPGVYLVQSHLSLSTRKVENDRQADETTFRSDTSCSYSS